jgi:hypothetical protein
MSLIWDEKGEQLLKQLQSEIDRQKGCARAQIDSIHCLVEQDEEGLYDVTIDDDPRNEPLLMEYIVRRVDTLKEAIDLADSAIYHRKLGHTLIHSVDDAGIPQIRVIKRTLH